MTDMQAASDILVLTGKSVMPPVHKQAHQSVVLFLSGL